MQLSFLGVNFWLIARRFVLSDVSTHVTKEQLCDVTFIVFLIFFLIQADTTWTLGWFPVVCPGEHMIICKDDEETNIN